MGKRFGEAEKAKWAEEREAKVARAKELLAEGVRELQSSEQWRAMLERVARSARGRFRVSRYSFINQMLVWMQAPHATATAGYKQWQAFGRQVRKGETGIMIRQPRPWVRTGRDEHGGETEESGIAFGTAFVFDISQTEGELPEPLPQLSERLDPAALFAFGYERLREVALGLEGAPVSTIDVRPLLPGDPKDCAGWYVRNTKAIVVLDNGNPAEMFATLAHEIAHSILHGAGEHHETTRTREVEAESVAFIIAHAVGLDTSRASFPYVASWAGRDNAAKRVLESGERIARAANQILAALLAEEPCEELRGAAE
jgi:antirestriction protein ArdC